MPLVTLSEIDVELFYTRFELIICYLLQTDTCMKSYSGGLSFYYKVSCDFFFYYAFCTTCQYLHTVITFKIEPSLIL